MNKQPSKQAIQLRIDWINKALGRPCAAYVKRADGKGCEMTTAFYVDHGYGGYRIECQGYTPFGSQRMNKRELVDQMEAILVAIKLARGEIGGAAWPKVEGNG